MTAARIEEPPRGWQRVRWLGPGFLWMVSAAGSGELLFTPRIGSQYGYALLWALVAAVTLKWFINREIGRYAVCAGRSVLDGFSELPGPGNWAIWLIIVPQLAVAAVSIAGFASASATALIVALPGPHWLWAVVCLLSSAAMVVIGRYAGVELASRIFAVLLAVMAMSAAISTRPSLPQMADGLVPRLPAGVDYGEVLPWLGYMLSGAAGLMWYSFWITARKYGAAASTDPVPPRSLDKEAIRKLRGWISQMTFDTTVAVVGALIITLAFLVLGTELLRPRGLLPAEEEMASVLGTLLSGVWGRAGFWMMVTGVFIGFFDTLLSDQDGFCRMFASGARLLSPRIRSSKRFGNAEFLRRFFVIGWVTLVPIAVIFAFGDPVTLLKISGAIEAAHIPVVTALILYLNLTTLPAALQPSRQAWLVTGAAGVFFLAFAVFYLVQLAE